VIVLEEVEVASRRIDVDKIIKSKDCKNRCPRCFTPMRYKKIVGKMANWAPSPYAWICPVCPVVWHDGTIKEGDDTWCRRLKEEEVTRISVYLNTIFSRDKKK